MQVNTRCFARRGHTVAILSPVPAAAGDLEVLSPSSGHTTAWRRALSYAQMVGLLHRWRPDVALIHFASLPFNWLLPLVWFKPLAVTLAGADILFHQRPGLSPRRQRATLDLLDIADCVISRSDYMLAEHPALQARAIVSPWGVDLELFSTTQPGRLTRASLGLPENAPVIFSPRRMVPICGVDSIVEALALVRRRLPNAALLAVDDQPDPDYRRSVRERVGRLGLHDAVRWIDSVAHNEMPDLYRLADVTVSVARSDGISGAVLESMAARTPVVLGDIPNYAGIFTDREHCRLVDPRDPQSIADGVVEVITDRPLRDALVEAAYMKVAEYGNLARETERIAAALRAAVDSPSRPLRLEARARHALKLAMLAVERDG